MKKQKLNVLLVFCFLVIVATIIGCGTAGDGFLIPLGGNQFQFFPAKFAFVLNGNAAATIDSFTVNDATGALTAVTKGLATNMTPGGTVFIDVDPNSHFLFVPNYGTSTVSVFSVGADGSVSGPNGTDIASGGNQPFCAKLHPSGKFLYVTNRDSNNVAVFSVGANGALTAAGTPVTTGALPHLILMDWQGRYLYITHESWYGDTNPNNTVDAFSIDSQTGMLTAIPGSPFNTGITPRGGIVDYSGQYLILANRGNDNDTSDPATNPNGDPGSISVFSIQSTGALTSVGTFKDPACIAAPAANSAPCGPFNITEAIVNNTTYIAANNLDSHDVSVFTMDTTTGKLTTVSGSPFLASTFHWPHYGSVDTSGQFGYVVDYGTGGVGHGYIVQLSLSSTGTLTQVGSNITDPSLSFPTQIVFSH